MTRVNFHFHDEHSSDAVGSLTEHCSAALQAGVMDICVTNHVEMLSADGTWRVDLDEAQNRFAQVRERISDAREHWPELRLRLGAEFEYRPEWLDVLDRLAALGSFDFIIGSVHMVDGINISGGGDVARFFDGRDQEITYRRYFETLLEMVDWGGFDVVGHFDLIKRYGHQYYGPYDPAAFEPIIRATLTRMAESGIGIEINTSGVGQAPRVPYPEPEILEWAASAGVRWLTLGSDSHAPGDFAQGLDEGYALARRTGWDRLSVFDQRIARELPIHGTGS